MKKFKLFVFLTLVCSAAAAIYIYREQLKKLPLLNRLAGSTGEDEPEEDILREYEETMARSSGGEAVGDDAEAGHETADSHKDKEEKSSRNKIRRGYTEIHFHSQAEAEVENA